MEGKTNAALNALDELVKLDEEDGRTVWSVVVGGKRLTVKTESRRTVNGYEYNYTLAYSDPRQDPNPDNW
jgi:hypothetical protein